MNHKDAQRAMSEHMDGERLPSRTADALDRHLASCPTCRAFETGAWRLRETARFGIAEPVPDLVAPIMASVRADRGRRASSGLRERDRWSGMRRRSRSTTGRGVPRPRWTRSFAPVAASLLVGAVAGSLTVGGPWRPDALTTLASAADVSAGVARAATRLQAYQATFTILESDPTHSPDRRELTMRIAFRAPERFNLTVTDQTLGADTRFVADNLQLVVNGSSAYQVMPSACPVGVCPARARVVRNRLPFSSATPAPSDLILPVATLVDARQMTVVGEGRVMGRPAVEVRLPFERARPLFPFLTLGGTWRPFFPGDRVELWLDARSWFPLRYVVYPAAGPGRDEWQLRFGLPDEPPGRPVFEARAISIDPSPPPESAFHIPRVRAAENEGGREVPIEDVRQTAPSASIAPSEVAGLPLYRAVVSERDRERAVLTYSSGLSWLKLAQTHASSGEAFFGPVGPHAEAIQLEGLGIAYYEPASPRHGGRLAIHTPSGEVYLETNLPRARLLDAAQSLDVRSAPVPRSWLTTSSPLATTERMPLDRAIAAVGFEALRPPAPPGFAFASAELLTVAGRTSLNLYFQRNGTDFETGSLRIHEEAARELPPVSGARQFAMTVNGVGGRWTPGRHQLEWIQDGVYCSLDAGSLGLAQLIRVAGSMTPASDGLLGTPAPTASAQTAGGAGSAPTAGEVGSPATG